MEVWWVERWQYSKQSPSPRLFRLFLWTWLDFGGGLSLDKKKGCQDDKTMSEAGNVIFSSCRDQMSLFLVLSDERGNKLENK